ncbi:MAG TPA: hypothetical protein VGP33_07465 [Chloroflexota bacterium]|nr:hypothetical protein [Chloroflexota bacterium]
MSVRLGEINRIGDESGKGYQALAAAVLLLALTDAAQGIQGGGSDPALARAWLADTGREWLDSLRLLASSAANVPARRVA